MYTVIIVSSIPPLYPSFNKQRNTALNVGDHTNLTSASLPPGRARRYPSGATRNTAIQIHDDDSVEESGTENRPGYFSLPGKSAPYAKF